MGHIHELVTEYCSPAHNSGDIMSLGINCGGVFLMRKCH